MNLPASTAEDQLAADAADADDAPDTAEWPTVGAAGAGRPQGRPQRPAPPADPDDNGITWIGPSTTAGASAHPGRRRLRLLLGCALGAGLLTVAGTVMANLVTRAHDDTTSTVAVPVPVEPADDEPAADSPGAVAAAPSPTVPSAPASSPPTVATHKAAPAPTAPRSVTQPPARPGNATLELVTSAASVTFRSQNLGDQLYRVSGASATTSDDGPLHRLTTTGATGPVTVVLTTKARWTVRMTGGTAKNLLDFSGSSPAAIELAGGASATELLLPPASGTLPVLVSKGISELHVHPAKNDPIRLDLRSGAGRVLLDGRTRSGVAVGAVILGTGWDAARDRIDLRATAGMSLLSVEGR